MSDSRSDATGALAAGIMFMTDDARVLLVQRAGADHIGEWAFPGGNLEAGETAEQAALREAYEELGDVVPKDLKLVEWMRRVQEGVDFTTFLGRIKEPFVPTLNEEHSAFDWIFLKDLIGENAPMTQVPEVRTDPPVSEQQRKAMEAAAHGHSTLGIPASVGKEFAEADPGGKLPKRADDAELVPKPGDFIAFADDAFTDKGPANTFVISFRDGHVGVDWGAGELQSFAWDKLAPNARRISQHGKVTWQVGR